MKRLKTNAQKAIKRSRSNRKAIQQSINTITRILQNPDLPPEEKENLESLLLRAHTNKESSRSLDLAFIKAAKKAQHQVRETRAYIDQILASVDERPIPQVQAVPRSVYSMGQQEASTKEEDITI